MLDLRSRRIRTVLIPLNLILATAMLISLILGTPAVTVIGIPFAIVLAVSAIAMLVER